MLNAANVVENLMKVITNKNTVFITVGIALSLNAIRIAYMKGHHDGRVEQNDICKSAVETYIKLVDINQLSTEEAIEGLRNFCE